MDYVRSIGSLVLPEQPKALSLQSLCQHAEPEGSAAKLSAMPDTRFDDISRGLERDVQNPEWTSRPRTYFILVQIRRIDAMDAFIAQGLNDTSLPYRGRSSLPRTLEVNEAEQFLRWQHAVVSDTLYLEQGKHIRLANGDLLFDIGKKLGIGSKGSTIVDKIISKATGKIYARKRIDRKKYFGHDTKSQKIYENEIDTLKKVADHHHLIKVKGTYTDKRFFVLLLQPVADENLKQYMSRKSDFSIEEQARFRGYFGCLAHTMRFLHDSSMEVLHKDIKPENILLKDGRLILTDFGTAFDWSKTGQSMTQSNANDFRTPRYQSPEAALGEFHRSSDIWSLGVVFLEMVTILRGKTLEEMDSFLQNHGQRVTSIHNNIEGAMQWFEQLQAYDSGSPIDNEPLTWIKAMLNRVHSNRPTAANLFDNIESFQEGRFCGRCCLEDSESTSDDGFESDMDLLSDISEHDEAGSSQKDGPILEKPRPRSASRDRKIGSGEKASDVKSLSRSNTKDLPTLPSKIDWSLPSNMPLDATSSSQLVDLRPATIMSSQQDPLQVSAKKKKSTKESSALASRKVGAKSKPKVFHERDTFIQWLASIPEKFASKATYDRSTSTKRPRPGSRAMTIESQRINHFLSSLPQESTEYEETTEGYSKFGNTMSIKSPERSWTMPQVSTSMIRSKSQEDLQSSSHLLHEEDDANQFADVGNSRLVRCASDGEIDLASTLSREDMCDVVGDLRTFAARLQLPKSQQKPEAATDATATQQDEHLTSAIPTEPRTPANETRITEADEFSLGHTGTAISSASGEQAKPLSRNLNEGVKPAVMSPPSTSSTKTKLPSLGAFIKKVPPRRRRRFESASVIMERILDDKSSEAPTSLMSVNTRAIVSRGRIGLRWNDRAYGWLPKFVADGKVGAVRECLSAGCNPGTVQKPRWAPVYNAVRGKSDRHLKCLRALVEYGADVNAKRSTNGRTALHYAVESESWSSYSSVIYTLLAAGADPNTRDAANDLPLLMLLVGNGPLSQEQRNALFLLIAPNFSTNLNVRVGGTLDNPLHLAIRRKDVYTVEAILGKMDQVKGVAADLMHAHNGSGFTPLLLALTIFQLNDEAEEEIQIINYLLKHGAKANDRDVTQGKTPLHLTIGGSKNTLVLELLCRHSANPRIPDSSGLIGSRAIDLVRRLQVDYPQDAWYTYAARRMENTLTADDYRPPELEAFLAEEP